MSALDELIAAVEAGAISTDLIMAVFDDMPDQVTCLAAFDGYLDAAKALHDALLPGWWFAIQPTGVTVANVETPHDGMICDGASDVTARAWLLAILRALQAKGGAQ